MSVAGPRYAEYAAAPSLQEIVFCGWTLESESAIADHRVLPDGCIDVLVGPRGRVYVAGPATTAFLSPLPAGGFAAGIRFRPGAAPAVLGVGADELRDRLVALEDVWGRAMTAPIAEAPDAATALRLLHAALSARLPAARRPDPAVLASARRLAAEPATTVAELTAATGLSERQLRRRFQIHVGYGPKRLARVLRLQRLLAAPAEPLAQRALAAGYADQAHMTRECVALAGLPPTRLVA